MGYNHRVILHLFVLVGLLHMDHCIQPGPILLHEENNICYPAGSAQSGSLGLPPIPRSYNIQYYKVPVPESSKMTSATVLKTCASKGLTPPCFYGESRTFNDGKCTRIPDCKHATEGQCSRKLSQILCKTRDPHSCPSLLNVFWYMGTFWESGSACGATTSGYCSFGKDFISTPSTPLFAVCVNTTHPTEVDTTAALYKPDVKERDRCCKTCEDLMGSNSAFIFTRTSTDCACRDYINSDYIPNQEDFVWFPHPFSGFCGWSFLEGVNCNEDDGAVSGLTTWTNVDLATCIDSCKNDSYCEGVFRKNSDGTGIGDCVHRRTVATVRHQIQLDKCLHKGSWDLYKKPESCSKAGGIKCCPEYTIGDNDGKGGEKFVQEEEYNEEKGCKDTCLDLYPDARGITESLTQKYANKKHNKCWCEMGDPVLKENAGYQTCIFK